MHPSEKLVIDLDKSIKYGTNIANKVLYEFLGYLQKKNIGLCLQLTNALMSEAKDPMTLLRTKFLANPSVPLSCTNKFYEILQKNFYREEDEILECMSSIADNEKQDLSFWKRCSWIKEICYDEKSRMYTIITSKGNFSFLPISKMFQRETEIIRTIGKKQQTTTSSYSNGYNPDSLENFDYNCHFVSYEFSKLHPEVYAVTAACPHCFPNTYWFHSYNISYDSSYIIDISNGFVMPIDDFNRLLQPYVLDKTKGEDIPVRLQEIKNSKWPFSGVADKVPLKALAFYQFDSLTKEERLEIFNVQEQNLQK